MSGYTYGRQGICAFGDQSFDPPRLSYCIDPARCIPKVVPGVWKDSSAGPSEGRTPHTVHCTSALQHALHIGVMRLGSLVRGWLSSTSHVLHQLPGRRHQQDVRHADRSNGSDCACPTWARLATRRARHACHWICVATRWRRMRREEPCKERCTSRRLGATLHESWKGKRELRHWVGPAVRFVPPVFLLYMRSSFGHGACASP